MIGKSRLLARESALNAERLKKSTPLPVSAFQLVCQIMPTHYGDELSRVLENCNGSSFKPACHFPPNRKTKQAKKQRDVVAGAYSFSIHTHAQPLIESTPSLPPMFCALLLSRNGPAHSKYPREEFVIFQAGNALETNAASEMSLLPAT